jgi:hypothetical protein
LTSHPSLGDGHGKIWKDKMGAIFITGVGKACDIVISGWWFGNMFHIIWEFHHPN